MQRPGNVVQVYPAAPPRDGRERSNQMRENCNPNRGDALQFLGTDVTRADGSVGIFYNPKQFWLGNTRNPLNGNKFLDWHSACIWNIQGAGTVGAGHSNPGSEPSRGAAWGRRARRQGENSVDAKRRRSVAQALGFMRGDVAYHGGGHVPLPPAGIRDDRGLLGDVVDIRRDIVRSLRAE
jgi:hypothetical protein